MFLFGRKKETPEEKNARIERLNAEIQKSRDAAREKYENLCNRVDQVLEGANKPQECNTIRFAVEPYLFPDLKSYQCFFVDWEVWRHDDKIYIFRSEVENYPEEYYEADAPAIAYISISDIQYFRIEGSTYTESRISGGQITQNARTGRIKQAPLRSTTINHDNRVIKMSVLVNGIVKILNFEYSSLDVLCALLPEKERK